MKQGICHLFIYSLFILGKNQLSMKAVCHWCPDETLKTYDTLQCYIVITQQHINMIDVKFASGIKDINFCFFAHTPMCVSTVYSVLSRVSTERTVLTQIGLRVKQNKQ